LRNQIKVGGIVGGVLKEAVRRNKANEGLARRFLVEIFLVPLRSTFHW
jgi:hypothetical protein